jgi:colanic acid biosynthesis glycosyl transferase WcaI
MAAKRRILIVNRHYWPDVVTYGQMLRHIAGRWAADGHAVDVLAALPSYRPESGLTAPWHQVDSGVNITRLRLFPFRKSGTANRLVNSVPFFLGLVWHMLRHRLTVGRYDFVLAATNPPIVEALLVRLLCALLGSRLIYHVQDIHPEVEVSAGVLRTGTPVTRFLQFIDAAIVRSAACCVTLSQDMRHELLSRYRPGTPPPDIRIINNFSFELDMPARLPAALQRDKTRFRLIFAGNIGFFQGLEDVVRAAHQLTDIAEFELLFVGNGVAVPELERLAGPLLGSVVNFLPFQPIAVAHALVEDADLAMISLKPGVIRFAYPSKTMTYTASGTAILAIVEADSELAQVVRQHALGLVVEQGDTQALVAAIRSAHAQRAELAAGRTTRRLAGEQLFAQERALSAWSGLIDSL